MDRRARASLLMLALAALANFNALVYTAPILVKVYPTLDEGPPCFGFAPGLVEGLPVKVQANGKNSCEGRAEGIFESLKISALLPPGTYMMKVGRLYVITEIPRFVTLYVEEGVEGLEVRTLLRGNGKAYELVIKDGKSATVLVTNGVNVFDVWLYINATSPGAERFRIGAYLNGQNGGS